MQLQAEGLLTVKSFCFTGELVTMKRADAEKLVKENGGTTKSSVTKDLSYLVTNDTESGSSKNQKAQKFGIPIKWVGVGEGIDDLEPFDPKEFVENII